MRRSPALGTLAAGAAGILAAAALAGCSTSPTGGATTTNTNTNTAATTGGVATAPATSGPSGTPVAAGDLVKPDGSAAGRVEVTQTGDTMQLVVEARGLTPGFHGLHLHAVGKCEPKSADPKGPTKTGDFLSSGGHLDASGAAHPGHDGDLPSLYVGKDGTGRLTTVTDRLTRAALGDADGAALLIHGLPDNAANIPTRYAAAGADAETKKAGDAGPRVACAALTAS